MTKKVIYPEDKTPFDYQEEVEAAKKLEKSSTEKIVSALRSDMLPASSAVPTKKNIFQQLNFKLIGGVLIGFVILGLIWFSLVGPGRPILEQKLANLINLKATDTQQVNLSVISTTNTQIQPSETPLPSPTVHPTNTPTLKIVLSPTPAPTTTTPTPTPACRDVSTITLADVGQTLCVQGTVIQIVDQANNFMLIFSDELGAFYWFSYDMVWSKAKVGTCYQIRGKIRQISNNPILVFDYHNIPLVCP